MSLTVYKSSAGSGKTTTLVNEYLKVTLKKPKVFRHVLAITFTNKAANEMKERILIALEEIISGNAWNKNEYKFLFQELALKQGMVMANAKTLQTLILHNYDEFAVSTIDSFVHRIIRTFATDVKLPQNFEVVIDEDDIIPDIVEALFEQVGSDENLTSIMLNFVMSQTDDEKTYDPGRSITGFVKKQLEEEGFRYLQKIDHLSTAEFVGIINKVEKRWKMLESIIKKNGTEALSLIHAHDLAKTDFYQGGKGIYLYFDKSSTLNKDDHLHPNSYIQTTLGEDRWTSGKASQAAMEQIDHMKDQLIDYFNNIHTVADEYYLFKFIRQKIYALALTKEIRSVFMDFTDRTQKVHISEFNKRISEEIAKQPVPFIYERLGRRYRYFLIDEFQDTSVLQWDNLLPLIEESLSYGHFNMLVGDAKQAIYRFRNGEVELFTNLPAIYQADDSTENLHRGQMLAKHYEEKVILENYRSREEIIKFNNNFFGALKKTFKEKLQGIYKHHAQIVPKDKDVSGGYVALELIEAPTPEVYAELRLEKIGGTVEKFLDSGYTLKDICVLTRTNNSSIEVAAFLLSKNYKVISSESLLLTNSPAVRLIIAFFRMVLYPQEKLYLADFVYNFLLINGENGQLHTRFEDVLPAFDADFRSVFSQLGIEIDVDEIIHHPIYDLTEYLIREFQLANKTNIYLQYFLDFVFRAQENGRMTVDAFLEYWNKKKNKAFISMPEGEDAIRVMTVHKAKGLAFEAVIVDITDRRNQKGKSEFWTSLNVPGLEEMKIGLLPLVKNLEYIGMGMVYEEEDQKTELDFANMVYVAFTRARSALVALGHIGGRKEKFTGYLQSYLHASQLWEDEKMTYEFGELMKNKKTAEKDQHDERSDNEKAVDLKKMISSKWEEHIRVAPVDEVYWEAIDSKPARTYGNLIHAILAKIKYAEDIEKAVNAYMMSGFIDELEGEDIRSLLDKIVNHPALSEYFKFGVLVKNETDLIAFTEAGKTFQRPDRVVISNDGLTVIDYKTGEKKESHIKQINHYADLFSSMGFDNINKKLVYINEGVEVIEV